jgi:hypothetical protein
MSRNRYTGLRYARPSFLEGVGRLFDFGGFLNTRNTVPTLQDDMRLDDYLDLCVIGEDMRYAVSEYATAHDIEMQDVQSR